MRTQIHRSLLVGSAALLINLACSQPQRKPPQTLGPTATTNPARDAPRSFTILAVNDVYRIEGVDGGTSGGLARLRTVREELERQTPDLLLLHAGDFLFPSLLSREFQGEQMIDVMNRLDGDSDAFDHRLFITFGNHEFDKEKLKDAAMLDKRIEDSQFSWLGTNIDFASAADGRPFIDAENLLPSYLSEHSGVRVGLFSLSTNEKKPDYVHCFGEPKAVARRLTADLRQRGAEVVVALTHLPIAEDVDLLRQLGSDGPDLLIGGHEHNRLFEEVNGRWVIKADAEARSATIATVTVRESRPPEVDFEIRDLDAGIAVDGDIQARVDYWLTTHGKLYCEPLGKPPTCLQQPLGHTNVKLFGEELTIRRFETNLGNWIVDQALERFRATGAQIAFLNSGSLRLNQNIPAEGPVTLRHIEEIFQYPSELELLKITGRVLQEVVSHAVTDWTGNGRWLQVSGFAFRHNPATGTADHLTLLAPEGSRPIDPAEELLVATSSFLAAGGDGYEMLERSRSVETPDKAAEPADLRELVIAALEAAGEKGISPVVEGRVCNTQIDDPCLALKP